MSRGAICPDCGSFSGRRHSLYFRQLDDLPLAGHPLLICWQVRRFFCDNADCSKRTFAENLAGLAPPYAHRTVRQAQILTKLGLALGGKAAERLAEELRISVSRPTVLRLLAKGGLKTEQVGPVRVLGYTTSPGDGEPPTALC